jgi:hypothetical protein
MPWTLQRRWQPVQRLHCPQPSNSLKQHIFDFFHKLETNGSVLSDDVIVRIAQATQFCYNKSVVIIGTTNL